MKHEYAERCEEMNPEDLSDEIGEIKDDIRYITEQLDSGEGSGEWKWRAIEKRKHLRDELRMASSALRKKRENRIPDIEIELIKQFRIAAKSILDDVTYSRIKEAAMKNKYREHQ